MIVSQRSVLSNPVTVPPAVPRNIAVDVYRGFVMFLMMAEVLELAKVYRALPESAVTLERLSPW